MPNRLLSTNGYGLFNVAGNVAEWCWDCYDPSYYAAGQTDPQGPGSAGNRVLRGGNWSYDALLARCANRYNVSPDYASYGIGFSLCEGALVSALLAFNPLESWWCGSLEVKGGGLGRSPQKRKHRN